MEGFTVYRDNLGVFPYTHISVPAIFSGKIYRNHMPIGAFLDQAMGEHSILQDVSAAGYDIDMVVPSGLKYMYRKSAHTNLSSVPRRMHISDSDFEDRAAAKLFDLSLFRLSPHFLKKYVYNDQVWLLQSLMVDDKYLSLAYFSHMAFLRNLHENLSVERPDPVYKFLHLMLSHNPIVANEECGYAGRVLPTVRNTVKIQAMCSLVELKRLFDRMKQAGIYEKSLIILMGDHGAWVAPPGLKGKMSSDGKSIEIFDPGFVALSQPLLAIKRPGAKGALQFSDAPSWIIDTAATIADVLNLDGSYDGRSVYTLGETENRVRGFHVYQYQRSEWTDDYLSPIQYFRVDGKGADTSTWQETLLYLPGGDKQKIVGKSSLWKTTAAP
jgi:hypothetical protein